MDENNVHFDPRLGENWKLLFSRDLPARAEAGACVIISYPDDEGVRLNNGRTGASEGPPRIVHYLSRMVYQAAKTPRIFVLSDRFLQPQLSERHEAAEKLLLTIFNKGYRVISLGGGHDYGYPDASALFQKAKGKILNVDAHLDMRPVVDGKLNSGTAYFRFIERFGGKHLAVWGVQEQCNALSHKRFAKNHGVRLIPDLAKVPRLPGLKGISFCLDAFQGIRGVSAPAVVGIDPRLGVECLKVNGSKCLSLGLYESAPRYDPTHEDSARLAALYAYTFIHLSKSKK